MIFSRILIQILQDIEIIPITVFDTTEIGKIGPVIGIASILIVRLFIGIGKSSIFQRVNQGSGTLLIPQTTKHIKIYPQSFIEIMGQFQRNTEFTVFIIRHHTLLADIVH